MIFDGLNFSGAASTASDLPDGLTFSSNQTLPKPPPTLPTSKGAAVGSSVVLGQGLWRITGAGLAAGTAVAAGRIQGQGLAVGRATVLGVGAGGDVGHSGAAAGVATVRGRAQGQGRAAGTSTATASVVTRSIGLAAGVGTALADELNLFSDGNVLIVRDPTGWPTSDAGLPAGAVWYNGGPVGIVPGGHPLGALPLLLGRVSAKRLLQRGAADFEITDPARPGGFWNNGGEIAISPTPIGVAAGIATAVAVNIQVSPATGLAVGTSAVAALAEAKGLAAGVATVAAQAQGIGAAAGAATVLGVQIPTPGVGVAGGTSTVLAIAQGKGLAAGVATVAAKALSIGFAAGASSASARAQGRGLAAGVATVAGVIAPPIYSDGFDSVADLQSTRTVQAGNKWQLIAPNTPDGRGGPTYGEAGTQYWVNIYRPGFSASGIYSVFNSRLRLGLMATPSGIQAAVDADAGASMPFIGTLVNSTPSYLLPHGYHEIVVAVPKIGGFTFEAALEAPASGWPPEIDIVIYTNADNSQYVKFTVWDYSGGIYSKGESIISPLGWNGTVDNTYGVDVGATNITFYLNGTQVFQTPTPTTVRSGTVEYDLPMQWYLLTASGYAGDMSDPNPASLPAWAEVDSVKVWSAKP